MPGLPAPDLDPDIVFFAFLPPLLLRRRVPGVGLRAEGEFVPISRLAVGLVLVTVVAVAARGALGRRGSRGRPRSCSAPSRADRPGRGRGVVRRLGAPSRIETILEGEALVNDGTGLTAYKIALAAVAGSALGAPRDGRRVRARSPPAGSPSARPWDGCSHTLRIAAREPSIDVVLSVLTPFAAYVPAESSASPACSRW